MGREAESQNPASSRAFCEEVKPPKFCCYHTHTKSIQAMFPVLQA